jgi:copper chaperone CopZ
MIETLNVSCPDIVCGGCANAIRQSLGTVPGVKNVEVEVPEKRVSVEYDASAVSETQLRERLDRAGFSPQ